MQRALHGQWLEGLIALTMWVLAVARVRHAWVGGYRPPWRRSAGTIPASVGGVPVSLSFPPSADGLQPMLASLLLKSGVSLGGLSAQQHAAALALAALFVEDGEIALSEAAVNARLREALSGLLQCLATDHVELRRWLVDSQWLQRDGYGRVYGRTPVTALSEEHLAWVQALSVHSREGWVAWLDGLRAEQALRRAQRRERWAQQQGPTAD